MKDSQHQVRSFGVERIVEDIGQPLYNLRLHCAQGCRKTAPNGHMLPILGSLPFGYFHNHDKDLNFFISFNSDGIVKLWSRSKVYLKSLIRDLDLELVAIIAMSPPTTHPNHP